MDESYGVCAGSRSVAAAAAAAAALVADLLHRGRAGSLEPQGKVGKVRLRVGVVGARPLAPQFAPRRRRSKTRTEAAGRGSGGGGGSAEAAVVGWVMESKRCGLARGLIVLLVQANPGAAVLQASLQGERGRKALVARVAACSQQVEM